MKRILHIFGKMDRAGAETRTMEIMRNIDRTRYKFDFVACSGQGGDYDDEIRSLGGNVYKISIYSLGFIPSLYRLIKSNRYDIVHSHIHYISGLIMFIAWLAGCKARITHFRTAGNHQENMKMKNRVMKLLIQLFATKIVAVNEYTMECVWGRFWRNNSKCSVIVNGIESCYIPNFDASSLRSEFNIGASSKIILHVGRIEKEKNHSFLIQVFSHYVKNKDHDAKLILVGKNNTREGEELRRKINELHLTDHVILTGVRNDVNFFFNAADLMIFPSLWEGLPGAVLEALSAGLPVIASDIGSHAEIKKEINNLRLLSLDDSIQTWSDEISKTIVDVDRDTVRKQFLNSEFYIDRYVDNFKRLYDTR